MRMYFLLEGGVLGGVLRVLIRAAGGHTRSSSTGLVSARNEIRRFAI